MKRKIVVLVPLIVGILSVCISCGLLSVATGNVSSSFFDDYNGDYEEGDSSLTPPDWILGTWRNEEAKRTLEFSENNVIIRYTSIENLGKTYGDSDKFKIEQDTSDPSSYIVYISNLTTGQNPIIYRFKKISGSQIQHSGANTEYGLLYDRQ